MGDGGEQWGQVSKPQERFLAVFMTKPIGLYETGWTWQFCASHGDWILYGDIICWSNQAFHEKVSGLIHFFESQGVYFAIVYQLYSTYTTKVRARWVRNN